MCTVLDFSGETSWVVWKNNHGFADGILKCIFLQKSCILIDISLKLVPKCPIDKVNIDFNNSLGPTSLS